MNIRTLLLLTAYVLLLFSCKSQQTATRDTSAVPTVVVRPPAEPVMIEEAPIVEEISTTEVTVRTESVTPVDRTDRNYGFYVIIGSFREIANARQYTVDLAAKGFSPTILASESGLFRVSVGGYDIENSARSQIADIRRRYAEHRDVWLLLRRQ